MCVCVCEGRDLFTRVQKLYNYGLRMWCLLMVNFIVGSRKDANRCSTWWQDRGDHQPS